MIDWHRLTPKPQVVKWLAIAWLLGVCYLAFIHDLGNTGLVDETEPLFAEASREMIVSGNWITPYFNGETRFDKPPLVYWAMAIGYQLIGINEWAVRLPSALSAIALVSLGFYTLLKFAPRHPYLTASLGAGLMAFNPETWVWGRIGVSDMLLCGCMGGALLCFFHGYNYNYGWANDPNDTPDQNQPQWNLWRPNRWYLAYYGLISLAVLTKGPVGVVLPGLIILSFAVCVGKFWEILKEIGIGTGVILFFGLTIPWYVLAYLENGQAFIDSFFGYHNLERFTNVVNGHDAPWYFYFLVVLVGFAPYSVYLPWSFAKVQWWKRSRLQRQPRQEHLGIFLMVWFVVIFAFFSIAITKLPSYVLPLMPAAGMLISLKALTHYQESTKGLKITGLINVLFLLALSAVFLLFTKLYWV
ncbi:MAG: glycosyltransferase family 39 protein [Synechococcaceae cyanobacterium RL_1_2]|nr:glycosyltransferase family 39 protein [Synechococcaceae cyanobacterium RL_1_2]